ncbi:MAG: fumarylacetoacetate hydrolase family protein [Thermoguttaceae bacterium]|nr:fumarylacetoacetate hydrolase family protein [Thermoguttaceae bacterium]MDW8037884.1 fumarylacetoacetate hydrolase family protein [Thermoguttaceae bacterium]
MKIIRYLDANQQVKYAVLRPDGGAVEIEGNIFGRWELTDRPAQVVKLLAPVAPPTIYCIGLNYRQHAAESNLPIPEFPVVFMKAPTAIQNPEDPIWLPRHLRSDQVDYEAELAVVIGKKGKNIPRYQALQYVLGYTCANDVSARDWQTRWGGTQWCRGKTFDTFCPLGPCLVTPDEIPDPNNLAIRLDINGQVLQEANTNDMIFDVARLIEFLSGSTTLLPGTVILTGTPQGVGFARRPPRWLQPGDRCNITIQHIGTLSNPVAEEPLS